MREHKLALWALVYLFLIIPMLVFLVATAEGARMRTAISHYSAGEIDRMCYRFMKMQAEKQGTPVDAVDRDYHGCALISEKYDLCLIYMTHKHTLGAVRYNRVLRHEKAHCEGWKH